jgi:hypothetical protein
LEKEKCPCCDNKTLSERDNFEICPICGWEDDPIQNEQPERWGGANGISLNLARDIWSWGRTGTCPLCGEKTLSAENRYEVCPICGWIDDPLQRADSANPIGANPMSLDFGIVAWLERQPFGLLHGKGWDESADHEWEALTLEPTRKKPLELLTCPCCGHTSLLTRGQNEDCGACSWTDDPAQSADPDLSVGANNRSLNQARIAWLAEQEASRLRIQARKAASLPSVLEEGRAPSFANESALEDADVAALEPV